MSNDFSELLQEAEKLTSNIEGVSDLPKIERSLRQVLEDSSTLYTRVARTGSQDVQANLLLGSRGIDLPRIVQKLEYISTKRTFEPIKPTIDIDVESHLENEMQNLITEVIEKEFQRCADRSKKNTWEHQNSTWVQHRMKFINAMTSTSRDLILIPRNPTTLTEIPMRTSNRLGNQESIYAAKIIEYNRALVRGNQRASLLTAFAAAAEDFKDTKVNDMWEIMKYMTELPAFPVDENVLITRNSKPVISALIMQAKRYLEDRYKTYMTNVINENLAEARRGGVPGTYSLARSYVRVRFLGEYTGLQGGMVEDRPLWPLVYYCLRSGDLSAALYCLRKAEVDVHDIIALLETKFKNPDHPDIAKLEQTLQYEYRRKTHNSTDPFQRAVYNLLCCCDTTDEHSEIARTADDYLWLKLSFMRIDLERDDSDSYRELQATILDEYGESHYNAAAQPHIYFQILALTGQFEAAFEFLARVERYQIHGVQMAIALNEMHMLAITKSPDSPLLIIDPAEPKPTRVLNICRLINIYVKHFEMAAPREAVHYFFMLRNILDYDKQTMFVKCVVDLAVETRAYEMLFGKCQRDGVRSRALLDEFACNDIKIEDIIEEVARLVAARTLLEDAIELYDIANNQEEVLKLLCVLLMQVVHLQMVEGSLRERLVAKANEIADRYSRTGYRCTADSVSCFETLRELVTFFDQYHGKQFSLALQTISNTKLVPLQFTDVDEAINTFKQLSMEVNKVMPDVLLATMNMLFAEYQKCKSMEYIPNRHQDGSQDKQLEYLRDRAKALTTFTGLMPFYLPGDFNSRLVQMEILMH